MVTNHPHSHRASSTEWADAPLDSAVVYDDQPATGDSGIVVLPEIPEGTPYQNISVSLAAPGANRWGYARVELVDDDLNTYRVLYCPVNGYVEAVKITRGTRLFWSLILDDNDEGDEGLLTITQVWPTLEPWSTT